MSQNYTNYEKWSMGEFLTRQILYGYDAPTGGFFFSEFYNSKEFDWEEDNDDYVTGKEGLVLSELVCWIKLWYNFDVDVNLMIEQLKEEKYPSPLQINIGVKFGKNIPEMLDRVISDLQESYSDYFEK